MTTKVEARIREALQFIDPCDRDTWYRMGMAIKSELGDTGYEVWETWSQKDASFNAKDARDVWKSISAGGKLTVGTLFHEAKKQGWRDDGTYQRPTAEELSERQRMAAERAAKDEAEIAHERAETLKNATAIWKAATEARADLPYLSRKRVSSVATLREIDAVAATAILGYQPQSKGERLNGRLLVVPVKVGNQLSTLELIDGDGRKTALAGRGTKAGGYWASGPLPDDDGSGLTLLIGEGVATVLSAKEASGHSATAALSSGNLAAVAKSMRERYPAAALVILADLLKSTGKADPHAIAAAQSVGGKLAIPDFGSDRGRDKTDFNDMAQLFGLEAVKDVLLLQAGPVSEAHQGGCGKAPAGHSARPEPLPALPDVLPFDYDYLPGGLQEFVRDISDRMQCPPDFAAVAVFVMMGTIIGRRVAIRPMRHNDWTVICNLWAAVVGNSGVMKSPTLGASLSPIKRLQSFAFEEFNQRLGDYATQEEVAKLQKAVTKSEAKKKLSKDKDADVAALLKAGMSMDLPVMKRYMTNNASYEALGELLMENPNGLMVESDEIIGLLKQLDAGGKKLPVPFI